MLNYLHGEIYRILRKKSMYIYFACFALIYFLFAFVQDGYTAGTAMLFNIGILFGVLPPIIGGYLFAALYIDDLSSKNLATLIGFGISKTKIVLSKLILMALFGGAIFGLLPLFMYGVDALLGHTPATVFLGVAYIYALRFFMLTFAFSALSAIVVYGLQRTIFSMTTYLLLSLGIVSQLITIVLRWPEVDDLLPDASRHLMPAITDRIMGGILIGGTLTAPVIEYVIYVGIAAALSVFAFRKKELKF